MRNAARRVGGRPPSLRGVIQHRQYLTYCRRRHRRVLDAAPIASTRSASRRAPGPRARIGAAPPRPTRQRSPVKTSRSRRGGRAPRPKPPTYDDGGRSSLGAAHPSDAAAPPAAPRRRPTSGTRPSRSPRGTPQRAGPAPGSIPTPGAPAPVLNRGVPRTGRRSRAPVGRGPSVEARAWKACPALRPASRVQRAAPRFRLRSATRRLAPRRPVRPLSSNQPPGTPLARSVFGLSGRGRPFRAEYFAAARRAGPVGVQRRALRLSGPPRGRSKAAKT